MTLRIPDCGLRIDRGFRIELKMADSGLAIHNSAIRNPQSAMA